MEIIIQAPDSTAQLSKLDFFPPLSVFAPSWHLFLLPQRPKVTKKTLVYFFYFLASRLSSQRKKQGVLWK